MATNTKIISLDEYKAMGLDFCDVGRYVDKKALRKSFKELEGKRVVKVCVWRNMDDEFKPILNKDVVYTTPVCCRFVEGAIMLSGNYFSKNPIGDVIIVAK